MRLWEKRLLPYLPDKMIVAEWRELIAIKRQWEKGTLKHRLVSYVKDYDKGYFANYVYILCCELNHRKIKYKEQYLDEIIDFCNNEQFADKFYKEHNDRYLRQCLYNLQEKADRGIINEEDWRKIENAFDRYL